MPRSQSKNQATILMDELKSSLKHSLETLNRIYMEAVSEKNFETIIKCDVEFKNINEQINSFPETKNLVKEAKMEEEFKLLSLFFKNVAEGCVDPKTGKCIKGKKAPVADVKPAKKVEKKEE